MTIKQVITEGDKPVKVWTDELDARSREQLVNLSKLPFIHRHVAAMPDVHCRDWRHRRQRHRHRQGAIIPAAVGVDIGCGMAAARTSLSRRPARRARRCKQVFDQISRDVPVGARPAPGRACPRKRGRRPFAAPLAAADRKAPAAAQGVGRFSSWVNQLGTLGGGNHFIEVCLDEARRVWVMLHSGSPRHRQRHRHATSSSWRGATWSAGCIQLPDRDLAYFPEGSEHFDDYVARRRWAQDYARENRAQMMALVLAALRAASAGLRGHRARRSTATTTMSSASTITAPNVWVTRKGAIRARAGDLGIIPGSMGARSYIVRGKGNRRELPLLRPRRRAAHEPHRRREAVHRGGSGAPRPQGVICRKDKGVLDEIPGAYKDIDQVMANQTDSGRGGAYAEAGGVHQGLSEGRGSRRQVKISLLDQEPPAQPAWAALGQSASSSAKTRVRTRAGASRESVGVEPTTLLM